MDNCRYQQTILPGPPDIACGRALGGNRPVSPPVSSRRPPEPYSIHAVSRTSFPVLSTNQIQTHK